MLLFRLQEAVNPGQVAHIPKCENRVTVFPSAFSPIMRQRIIGETPVLRTTSLYLDPFPITSYSMPSTILVMA